MTIRDGDWTLFDWDAKSGRSVWFMYDPVEEKDIFRVDYVVDNVLDENKFVANESMGERWGEGQRIASIPLNMFHDELQTAFDQGDRNYIARWLNDPDHRDFKTFRGQV